MGKIIIPIGSTGFAAHEIWEEVNRNITKYPYLEQYKYLLAKETDVNKITSAIISILNSIIDIR